MRVRSLRMLTALVVVALSTVGWVRAADPKTPTVLTGDTTWKSQPVVDAPSACDSDCCKSDRRFGLIGEFMYISARGVDLPFARIADGCAGDAVTRGALGIAQPDYSPAYRFGGWFDLNDCSGIQLTYSRLESHTNSSVFTGGNFVIQSLVTLPQTLNCASNSLAASSRYDIDFDLVDLDYGHNLWKGCSATIDWVAGVRYAHLDQDFLGSFTIQNATTVTTTVQFEGIGPRLGLQGEKRIGCGGFFFYGNTMLDLLAGNFRSDFLQRNRFTGVQGNVSFDNDRIVPVVELELGLGWTNKSGRITLQAGYSLASWFNFVTTPDFIHGVQTNNFTTNGNNLQNTLSFDGLTARIAFHF